MKRCIRCNETTHDGHLFCPLCGGEAFFDVERDEENFPFVDAFEELYEEWFWGSISSLKKCILLSYDIFMETFVVWTKTKSPIEADPRDYKAEVVLPVPTKEQIASLPEEFHNEYYIGKTYNQGNYGSCVAMGTTHSMLMQNTKELIEKNPTLATQIVERIKSGVNAIELIWQDLWVKMGHNLNDTNDSWDYVENGLNTANKKGIAWKDFFGNDALFMGDSFSYSSDYSKDMLKFYITKYPLIWVFGGNHAVWLEMLAGEVKTVLSRAEMTWFHCTSASGFVKAGVIVTNSRTGNDGKKNKCTFLVSWENIEKMVKSGMLNRRYRIEFDKKDATLDLDWYNEELNAIETLKMINKFYKKTRFNDVRSACGSLGLSIRKNYPNADKAVPKN